MTPPTDPAPIAAPPPPPPAARNCPKCKKGLAAGATFCAECGYRFERADAQERKAIGDRMGLRAEKVQLQQNIRSGRNTILVVTVLIALGVVITFFSTMSQVDKAKAEIGRARGNPMYDQAQVEEAAKSVSQAEGTFKAIMAGYIVVIFAFIGLWVWAKTKPVPATMTALIMYVTLVVIGFAVQLSQTGGDPVKAIGGFIGLAIPILIITFLIRAVNSARKFQELRKSGI